MNAMAGTPLFRPLVVMLLLAGCGHANEPSTRPVVSSPTSLPSATADASRAGPGETHFRWRPVPVPGGVTTRIPEAQLEFELPNPDWKLADHDATPGSPAILYGFKRAPVFNSAGEPVLPYIGVILEPVGPNEGNWVDYYAAQQPHLPPTKIERMLDFQQGEVGALNAGGYKGQHELGGRPHTVLVVFGLHGETGINIIMDATTDVFEQVEPEFTATLKSLRHYE